VWHVGPFPLRAYALCLIAGIAVAAGLGARRLVARGGPRGAVAGIALFAVPFGLVGARLDHVLTDWPLYFGSGGDPEAALRIWDGGLGIWGAIALGGVGAWIGCRRIGLPLPFFADAVAPGIVTAQAIGRLGNYFNQQLYGAPTTLPWGLRIYARVDPGTATPDLLNGVALNRTPIAVVHPTFLYELLWDLSVAGLVLWADRRFRLGHGRAFALYAAGYAAGRFWIEQLRTDPTTRVFGDVRTNVAVAVLVFLVAATYLTTARRSREVLTRWIGGQPAGVLAEVAGHTGRLNELFEGLCNKDDQARRVAVDVDGEQLSFGELDARANQLARYLHTHNAVAGDRIGLLFDEPVDSYVAMLAVLKINAAYVPLDVGFPADRISYIVEDAELGMLLTSSSACGQVAGLDVLCKERDVVAIRTDEKQQEIGAHRPHRLSNAELADPIDELAYIIYTSGSTGRPKGVAIEHPSICNFVRVAAGVYGLRARDRVYQGMTIAFDFSVEEIWVPWMAGATLVPKPAGTTLVGADLHDFLTSRQVSALCCVPTLLATIEDPLPDLRFLLVSGEACPQDLIARWYRPGRRFLNVYGPTEATVTATWTELHPDKPVTIGAPLPSYAIAILDRDNPRHALPHGQVGEIGIAGVGLAREYINRPEQTAEAFIPDFLDIPHNPSGRIYRTGDLGRINTAGDIEYRGRLDLQVKVRGYRIELTEIESVLLSVPGVAAAVVDTYEPRPGNVELVGYYSARRDGAQPDPEVIRFALREQLPGYMVPVYLEHLAEIPMTTSDKADRKNLPAPTGPRGGPGGEYVEPATETERLLADTLGGVLGLAEVSVTSDFFDELGATSLLVAQFTSAARARPELPMVSARVVFQHSTVRELARHLNANPSRPRSAPTARAAPDPGRDGADSEVDGGLGYVLTGAAQLMLLLAGIWMFALLLDDGYLWATAGAGWLAVSERAAVLSAEAFLALCVVPIGAKWLLVGRWTPGSIRLWSPAYVRFWLVKTLLRTSPMVLFAGSPLYVLYLRALGAKIGRDTALLFTPVPATVPVATDLLTVGAGTLVRPGCSLTGYRAVAGRIEIGSVTVGANCWVGQNSVLDINTSMGDGAQLGHSSSLQPGQVVPAGESWHGSPAEPAYLDHRGVAPARCGRPRRFVNGLGRLTAALVLGAAFSVSMTLLLSRGAPLLSRLAPGEALWSSWTFYAAITIAGTVAYFAFAGCALAAMVVLPRLLAPMIIPGRVYPLYGPHHLAHRLIGRLTNSRFLVLLMGDSSFIVYLLRALGYNLSRVEQTGSNFGTQLRHDSPSLTTVGTGSMISDGLTIMNADYSNSSFVLRPVTVGERNFIGNDVAFPAGARVGDNCLIATKAMVPMDGPVRHDTGLLGSPPFEIPRSTISRATDIDYPTTAEELAHRLAAKNRHNAATIMLVLASRTLGFLIRLVPLAVAVDLWPQFGVLATTVGLLVAGVGPTIYSALLERAALGFRPLTPQFCTIYDREFWNYERLWKFYIRAPLPGTPFLNLERYSKPSRTLFRRPQLSH
jgi:prolipoprotein diacylglyceryl transferase